MTTGVAHDARTVTAWNLLSRLTGFARVLVIGGALGATRLGDTYQAANQVSNLLFEFLAAGTLSAVLIPGLTARLLSPDPQEAQAFAGALLARAIAILGALGLVGIAAARPIMQAAVAENDSGSRGAQVRLGAFLLLFVMPQLVLYAWGAVMTAVLNANGRFAAGAAAPVANNLVVIATVGAFWIRGAHGLDLGWIDRTLLGGGVLGGVVCMTVLPIAIAARHGLRVRPRWHNTRSFAIPARDVMWATLVVVPPQIFFFGALMTSSRVSGGVVAAQLGFTLFLLPHALLGHPLTTVLYPRLAGAYAAGDHTGMQHTSGRGLRILLLLTAPASALLVALAPWMLPVVSIGELAGDRRGVALVVAALIGYGFGLSAYSWSLFVARVSYASGDVRTPAVAAVLGGIFGVAALVAASGLEGEALLYRVGLAHSLMSLAAVGATLAVLARRAVVTLEWRLWGATICGAAAAGVAARFVADRIGPPANRVDALAGLVAGAAVGLSVFCAAITLAGVRGRDIRAAVT